MAARSNRWTARLVAVFMTVTAAATAGCGVPQSGADLDRITIGTGPAGTLYSQIGMALTTLLQRELGDASTARPYTGSSIYLPHLERGELAFGINAAPDVGAAYRGELVYSRPMKGLRAAMLLVRAPYQYYVKADSDIRSLADLRGKPVVLGFRSVAFFDGVNAAMLATAGLGSTDIRPVEVAGVPDAVRALVEDRAVAAGTMLGIPAVREANATIPGGLRVLNMGPDEAKITSMTGFAAVTVQPGPAMPGVAEPTRIAQMDVYLNTSGRVSEADVYRLVSTIHRHWTELQRDLPVLRSLPAGEIVPLNIGHPYHEGAVRYFREAGLWTPQHEQLQQRLLRGET